MRTMFAGLQNQNRQINEIFARNQGVPLEVEARYGRYYQSYYNRQSFSGGVSRETFNRLQETFGSRTVASVERSTDYIHGSIRHSIYEVPSESHEEWKSKRELWHYDDYDYGIRLAINIEEPISPVNNFNPTTIRTKQRYSYLISGGNARIDLTVVDMKTSQDQKDFRDVTRYEVEVELLRREALNDFYRTLEVVLTVVQDTLLIYTQSERDYIIEYVNTLLQGRQTQGRDPVIDRHLLAKARNLHARDLVYGGLVGNPKTTYTVTHKADGIRKLLVFSDRGIWLVMNPNETCLLTRDSIHLFTGTVLDGEIIPKNKRKKDAPTSRYWFLVFDCLAKSGDISIQEQYHKSRMHWAQIIANRLKNQYITVWTKTFYEIGTVDAFFDIMRKMFSSQDVLPYENDGFMFTPETFRYNTQLDEFQLDTRVLTHVPDIVKWKPLTQMTIDFQIMWKAVPPTHENSGRVIELYVGTREGTVLFSGTRYNPFSPSAVNSLAPLTLTAPSGSIVEYRYDSQTERFEPVRIRTDKRRPNLQPVANDNWDWIHDPVTDSTLRGETFDLLFKYHNRIKRAIFSSVFRVKDKSMTLLDIGSGRGGDVAKWKKFSKIVAVEPNSDYLPELKRRIDLHNLNHRVLIVNTGGENTQLIMQKVKEFIGGPVDVVSMMLSMTFFWKSKDMVDSLLATIINNLKLGGELVFMTMDGDTVKQMFSPAFNGFAVKNITFGLKHVNFGPAQIEYRGPLNSEVNTKGKGFSPLELFINIPGTIVQNQTEWLVFLDDLIVRARKWNAHLNMIEVRRADSEKFLTREESLFSQMYSYGVFELRKKPKTPIILRPIISDRIIPPVEKVQELTEEEIDLTEEREKTRVQINLPVSQPITQLIKIRHVPLSMLPVIPAKRVGEPAKGDDVVQLLTTTWYDNNSVVRIAAIGDGSCFFHAILKAYLPSYQNNNAYDFRTRLVAKLRRDLALTLQLIDPRMIPVDEKTKRNREKLGYLVPISPNEIPLDNDVSKYKILYETAVNGAFVDIFTNQKAAEDNGYDLPLADPNGIPVRFDLKSLQLIFGSTRDVGDEVYGYVADMLGIDVYVLRGTTEDVSFHVTTRQEQRDPRPAVVIIGNGQHYEVVGIKHETIAEYQLETGETIENPYYLYQTYFSHEDPFIMAIEKLKTQGRSH